MHVKVDGEDLDIVLGSAGGVLSDDQPRNTQAIEWANTIVASRALHQQLS